MEIGRNQEREIEIEGDMGWSVRRYLPRAKRIRTWSFGFLCLICLMFFTPKIRHSQNHHLFADMRNFIGVPNTLNVISNFPFLIVGVIGLVLCLQGDFFLISSRAEALGWALFFAGITAVAFGSAYYHIKPDDNRVIWDSLPMMIAYVSLFSSLIVERIGLRIGLVCLFTLLILAFTSTFCERTFDDIRLQMMFQLIPCAAIPIMIYIFPPKYSHSTYWVWASGFYLLSKLEGLTDMKIYRANHYFISGHSLEHLFSVMVPVLLSLMLMFRNVRYPRLGEYKERA